MSKADQHPGRPIALVIRTAGTNCDLEMVRAFELAGAAAQLVHVDRLIENPAPIADAALIGLPGGFSYGDDVASGRLLALRLRERLWPALRDAAARGAAMIGVCNGFQVMVQAGLLPGPTDGWSASTQPDQRIALVENASASFMDDWCVVDADAASRCIWTKPLIGLDEDIRRLPIANGEGRLVASDETIAALVSAGQVPLRYAGDVNGSVARIAGLCDTTGRIFGLMPHPERYVEWTRHPFWTRLDPVTRSGDTPGLAMFRAAVEAAQSVPLAT